MGIVESHARFTYLEAIDDYVLDRFERGTCSALVGDVVKTDYYYEFLFELFV